MAKVVKSLKDLQKIIKQDITKKLNENSSQTKIKNINRISVSKEVYSVYKPTKYLRRADDGGLTDPENINIYVNPTNTGVKLTLENTTKPKGFDFAGKNFEYLAPIVEYGIKNGKNIWEKPRPFMKNTADELQNKKVVSRIIKEIKYIK